jgi:hypothetical protein
MPRSHQLAGGLVVQMLPLRLKVGTVRAFHTRPFIPIDPEPPEPVENRLEGFRLVAFGIGVVDAENELAAMPSREQPVEQRGTNATNMKITRWTRGKTRSDRSHR